MANTLKNLTLVCNQMSKNYLVKCQCIFHKTKLTQHQFRIIRRKLFYITVFPVLMFFLFIMSVMMKVYLKILQLKEIMTFINYEWIDDPVMVSPSHNQRRLKG